MDHLVAFVPDIPHQLLHHILQGNHPQGAAVIVGHDGQMALAPLELGQQAGHLHGAVDKEAGGHHLPQGLALLLHPVFQQIHLVDHADDVVGAVVIDRQPGIVAVQGDLQVLLRRVVDVQRHHIHPGGQDLLGGDVVKLQGRLDQVAFLLLQHPFLLDGLHHILQLFLGHGGLAVPLDAGGQILQLPEEPGNGGEDNHQRSHRLGNRHRQGDGIVLGQPLGKDLPKGEDQQRNHPGGQSGAPVPQQLGGHQGGQGGEAQVDDVVSHQHGGEGLVKILGDLQRQGCFLVSFLRQAPQPQVVGGGIGGFAGRKKGRQPQ